MPWTNLYPLLICFLILVPLFVAAWVKGFGSRLTTLLFILDYFAISLYFTQVVNWSLFNYLTRVLPLILTVVIAFRLFTEFGVNPWLPKKFFTGTLVLLVCVLILPVGILANRMAFKSYDAKSYIGNPVLMMFPLRNGIFVIMNGGNGLDGVGMNSYYKNILGLPVGTDQTRVYASDITKMAFLGGTSHPPLAKTNDGYEAFGEMVYAPCPGSVVYVKDGSPDLAPFSKDAPELGNYIVFQCEKFFITLSGFKQNSIVVKAGDPVDMGVYLGNIGNSAAPAIPHLHIHASINGWDGPAVPMLFEGSFAVDQVAERNKIFVPR
jgi:hypothetical protein